MILILLGPPGSGKGTSSNLICKKYNLFPLSTGDILRERMKKDDDFGKHISNLMQTGELLPDELINELVKEIINSDLIKSDYNGLLFDGYPRTVQQAHFLENLLTINNKKINYVLLFNIADNTIVERVASRRIDRKTGNVYNLIFNPPPKDDNLELYQRDDDKKEIILHRLEIYKKQTEPLIGFYKQYGNICKIDASTSINKMLDEIDKILSEIK